MHDEPSAFAVMQRPLCPVRLRQGLGQAAVHPEPRAVTPEIQGDPTRVTDYPAGSVDHIAQHGLEPPARHFDPLGGMFAKGYDCLADRP